METARQLENTAAVLQVLVLVTNTPGVKKGLPTVAHNFAKCCYSSYWQVQQNVHKLAIITVQDTNV